jgi:predicted nucleic acid-binding protein
LQRAFLAEFFMDPSLEWASDLKAIVHLAMSEADRHGLAAMDALHIAAAIRLRAEEFITTERVGKAIHRVTGVTVVHINETSEAALE